MREPRPRQRLPEGGLNIYERQKAGLWKPGAELLMVYPSDYKDPDGKPLDRRVLEAGYILQINTHFDPLLYFWPVENFTVIAVVHNIEDDFSKKLVRALLRDGAEYAGLCVRSKLSAHNKIFHRDTGFKEPVEEWYYEVDEKILKRRLFQ